MSVARTSMTSALAVAAVLLTATSGVAQSVVQFRSDLRIKDSSGKTGTAKLYVGAAKLRMEFQVNGETRPTIVEPRNETQFTVSPGQRKYMEMPLGDSGGIVLVPRIATVNPANPCANDRFSECKRIGAETLNGYATEKWEYTNVDGDRETAWISTRLRVPIRTTVDNGATTDITNVVEGAQPANLFDIPSGFAKVDDLDDGGGFPDLDPAVLNALDPATRRALEMAKTMVAQNPGLVAAAAAAAADPPPPASTGTSAYEGGPGWLLNVTITANSSPTYQRTEPVPMRGRSTHSARYTASIPLNSSAGPIPGQGPQWFLLALAGSGSPEANAAPFSQGIETRSEEFVETKGSCDPTGWGSFDTTTVTTRKGSAATTLARFTNQFGGSAIWKLNAALNAYSLVVQVLPVSVRSSVDQSQTTKRVDHCAADKVTNETKTQKIDLTGMAFEVKDIPLSRNAAGAIRGSTTIPWMALEGVTTATAEWTITRLGR